MPLTKSLTSKREVVEKANPYHDATGAFTSKDKDTDGKPSTPKSKPSAGQKESFTNLSVNDKAVQAGAKQIAAQDAKLISEINGKKVSDVPASHQNSLTRLLAEGKVKVSAHGYVQAPSEPRKFTQQEIQRALDQGRHDLAQQMVNKNWALEKKAKKIEGLVS